MVLIDTANASLRIHNVVMGFEYRLRAGGCEWMSKMEKKTMKGGMKGAEREKDREGERVD